MTAAVSGCTYPTAGLSNPAFGALFQVFEHVRALEEIFDRRASTGYSFTKHKIYTVSRMQIISCYERVCDLLLLVMAFGSQSKNIGGALAFHIP